MILETKYNIGDTVYLIDCYGKLQETVIKRLSVSVNKITCEIRYETNVEGGVESKFFTTKEEAGKSWLDQQGLNCGLVAG